MSDFAPMLAVIPPVIANCLIFSVIFLGLSISYVVYTSDKNKGTDKW